jgi:hypothetical protein
MPISSDPRPACSSTSWESFKPRRSLYGYRKQLLRVVTSGNQCLSNRALKYTKAGTVSLHHSVRAMDIRTPKAMFLSGSMHFLLVGTRHTRATKRLVELRGGSRMHSDLHFCEWPQRDLNPCYRLERAAS